MVWQFMNKWIPNENKPDAEVEIRIYIMMKTNGFLFAIGTTQEI